MNFKIFTTALVVCFLTSNRVEATENLDPYSLIEHITFENGLQVFLAPSKEATIAKVKLKVKVGFDSEADSDIGVSHLLEHVLFRDRGLKDEMTYLQLIEEAGGKANGSTTSRETSYYGTIPPDKATWLLDIISKMILHPTIEDQNVEKEKGTVELERGRPGPFTLALGFNPAEYFIPLYLKEPSFWKSEFNVSFDSEYSISKEQLSTRKLTTEQVKKHYEDYYYPANMQLFVSGKYSRREMIDLIKSKWASLPKTSGKILKPLKKPEPRLKPYVSQELEDSTPQIVIGTKIYNASLEDRVIVSAYTDYLSHRLMKEIRNLKGQTYSASPSTYVFQGYGFSTVKFETPKENLEENYNLAKDYILTEAESGKLSADHVKKAIELAIAEYKLVGREAENMMDFADTYSELLEDYGTFSSPYKILSSLSEENFNKTLAKQFAPNRRYESIQRPALFFQYDYYLLFAVFAIGLFFCFRHWLTKSFYNDQLRWVRNVKYPPLKSLELLALLFCWELIIHSNYITDSLFRSSALLQASIVYSYYLKGLIEIFIIVLISQGVLSFLPRKLMVVDKKLLIKSISYYSHCIPLSEIASVKAERPLAFPLLAPSWLSSVKFRFFYFDNLFWRKGLLINLKDGRSYFFSVKNSEKAATELSGFLA